MNIRRIEESDYDTLVKWWSDWGWTPVTREALPENGTGGIIVETNDGVPVCAGFLYVTNSSIAWIEWIISNKEVRGTIRGECLDALIFELTNWAESAERTVVFTIAKNRNLIERYKKQGFVIDEKPSYELTKKL